MPPNPDPDPGPPLPPPARFTPDEVQAGIQLAPLADFLAHLREGAHLIKLAELLERYKTPQSYHKYDYRVVDSSYLPGEEGEGGGDRESEERWRVERGSLVIMEGGGGIPDESGGQGPVLGEEDGSGRDGVGVADVSTQKQDETMEEQEGEKEGVERAGRVEEGEEGRDTETGQQAVKQAGDGPSFENGLANEVEREQAAEENEQPEGMKEGEEGPSDISQHASRQAEAGPSLEDKPDSEVEHTELAEESEVDDGVEGNVGDKSEQGKDSEGGKNSEEGKKSGADAQDQLGTLAATPVDAPTSLTQPPAPPISSVVDRSTPALDDILHPDTASALSIDAPTSLTPPPASSISPAVNSSTPALDNELQPENASALPVDAATPPPAAPTTPAENGAIPALTTEVLEAAILNSVAAAADDDAQSRASTPEPITPHYPPPPGGSARCVRELRLDIRSLDPAALFALEEWRRSLLGLDPLDMLAPQSKWYKQVQPDPPKKRPRGRPRKSTTAGPSTAPNENKLQETTEKEIPARSVSPDHVLPDAFNDNKEADPDFMPPEEPSARARTRGRPRGRRGRPRGRGIGGRASTDRILPDTPGDNITADVKSMSDSPGVARARPRGRPRGRGRGGRASTGGRSDRRQSATADIGPAPGTSQAAERASFVSDTGMPAGTRMESDVPNEDRPPSDSTLGAEGHSGDHPTSVLPDGLAAGGSATLEQPGVEGEASAPMHEVAHSAVSSAGGAASEPPAVVAETLATERELVPSAASPLSGVAGDVAGIGRFGSPSGSRSVPASAALASPYIAGEADASMELEQSTSRLPSPAPRGPPVSVACEPSTRLATALSFAPIPVTDRIPTSPDDQTLTIVSRRSSSRPVSTSPRQDAEPPTSAPPPAKRMRIARKSKSESRNTTPTPKPKSRFPGLPTRSRPRLFIDCVEITKLARPIPTRRVVATPAHLVEPSISSPVEPSISSSLELSLEATVAAINAYAEVGASHAHGDDMGDEEWADFRL